MNTAQTSTITKQQNQTETSQKKTEQERVYVLRLEQKPKQRVSWTEATIDNEHMNKKKSNLCCIYHRPGQSSSDTCTSDDEGNALERDRHTKHLHKKKCSKFNKKKQEKPQTKEEIKETQ